MLGEILASFKVGVEHVLHERVCFLWIVVLYPLADAVRVKRRDDAALRVEMNTNLQPRDLQRVARLSVPLDGRWPVLVHQMGHQVFAFRGHVVVQEKWLPDHFHVDTYGK